MIKAVSWCVRLFFYGSVSVDPVVLGVLPP
jgi:hypothetical protein